MVTKLFKIGLYVSSFFPLYVLLIIGNYEHLTSQSKIMKIIKFNSIESSSFWFTIGFLLLVSCVSLIMIVKRNQNEWHQFKGISKPEDNVLNYVVTYIVPLLSINISDTKSLIINLGLFLLLGFIYVKNNLVYLNPFFMFFGYNVYKTLDNLILISNYDIYDLKNLENERIKCRILSYKIYLVRKENNNLF